MSSGDSNGQLRPHDASAPPATADDSLALTRQHAEFSALLEVSKRIVSELRLDVVLQLVADKTRDLVEADLVLVPMLDEDRRRYTYLAASGDAADDVRGESFAVEVGMCGWVLQQERSLLFGEGSPLPMGEATTWERGQQSALLVPLFGRKRIIGGLSALGKRGGASFSQHDLDLTTMFASLVSVAIENAQLFRALEHEIDERKRTEATVRANESFIRSILESVDEGIVVVDRSLRILSANRAYRALGQATSMDPVGALCHRCSHGADRPCFELGQECPVQATFADGSPHTAVHLHKGAEGREATIEVRSFPLKGAAGEVTAVIEVLNDVTEKKRLEAQLYQAQRVEAIGTLAGGVAHDFNNILSAIVGYASLLQLELAGGDALGDHVDQILQAAEKARLLTRSLLAFSRKQVAHLHPVDVCTVITDCQKMLTRLIGEDVEFKVQCSGAPLVVEADPGQLEQVLVNLTTNARDAMPHGGTLTMATEEIDVSATDMAAHGIDVPGKYALLTVSDNGRGMDASVRDHIFEPFFTTKGPHHGTGLGLSIVYGIITKHKGFIRVSSEPGVGTTFKIYLPLSEKATRQERPEQEAAAPRGHETILLVEDEVTVRAVTRAVLRQYGYTVIEACDGEEAVRRFAEHMHEVQLVVTDLIMPKMNGRQAYAEMKRQRPDLKAIFTSGYTADIITQRALLEDGVDFIAKPLRPSELLHKIREVLGRR